MPEGDGAQRLFWKDYDDKVYEVLCHSDRINEDDWSFNSGGSTEALLARRQSDGMSVCLYVHRDKQHVRVVEAPDPVVAGVSFGPRTTVLASGPKQWYAPETDQR